MILPTFLGVVFYVLSLKASSNICLNTTSFCNQCTKSCKISYAKPIESTISLPQSFYDNAESIEITWFEIYLKASHFHQYDLLGELHLWNSSVELFSNVGYNKMDIDLTLGDNFTSNIEWDIYNLNCKCEAKTSNSIIDGLKDSILINAPLTLKIIDTNIPSNGTFDKWCIKKFCYMKKEVFYEPTLHPTLEPTKYPSEIVAVKSRIFNRRRIIFYLVLPVIAFLLGTLIMGFYCYKWSQSKNRRKEEDYSGTIVNTNNVSVDKLHNRINSDIENIPKIEKQTSEDMNGKQININEGNEITYM